MKGDLVTEMNPNIILIVMAFIWLVIAIIQDLRKREIENWLTFSLIILALSFRLFYSIFSYNYLFFLYGLLSFVVFFIIAHVFYYARLFSGGDSKFLFALAVVLPLSSSILENIKIFSFFIFLILLTGSIYTIIWSIFLAFKNKNKFLKEFKFQAEKNKKFIIFSIIISVILFALSVYFGFYILLSLIIIILIYPILYIYAKSVENCSMIKTISTKKLTEGDWLAESIKINRKTIKPSWDGLSLNEIKLIQKYKKKIKIKYGIPFSPSFLFAYIILLFI